MSRGKKDTGPKNGTLNKLKQKKQEDLAELNALEMEYSNIFKVLNHNQKSWNTAGFIRHAEKGISVAQRMMELAGKLFSNDDKELKRLQAVYLSKQAKLLLFLGRNQQASLLFEQSFNRSDNIVISYEAYNSLFISGYFQHRAEEMAHHLITLFKRGSFNVSTGQKNQVFSNFKTYNNLKEYEGNYDDVLKSFFFSALNLFSNHNRLDLVIKALQEHKSQISTPDFESFVHNLYEREKFTALCQLFSQLTFTTEQCETFIKYVLQLLHSGLNVREALRNFISSKHRFSMALLSWDLIKINPEQTDAVEAMNLARKATHDSRYAKESQNQKIIASFAFFTMARIYDCGLITDTPGFQQSDEKAFYYYKLAAEAGNSCCLQDMAIMYRDGQGVPQDLEKAVQLLLESVEKNNIEAYEQIPLLFSLRASTDPENRIQLIDDGINKSLEGIREFQKQTGEYTLGSIHHFYLCLAILYLLEDSKISLKAENGYQLSILDLIDKNYFKESGFKNRIFFEKYLIESTKRGNKYGHQILAICYLAGNYLEKDLIKASEYIEQIPDVVNKELLLVILDLEHAKLQTEPEREREACLQKAFARYSEIEAALNTLGDTDELISIRGLIDNFKEHDTHNQVTSIISMFQRRTSVIPGSLDRNTELNSALEAVKQHLTPSHFKQHKEQVLNSIKTIHVLLNKMRMSVPKYKNILSKLNSVQELLSKLDNNLTKEDVFTLIGYFQRWPVQNKEAITRLGFNVSANNMNNSKDIAHAILDISYSCNVPSINTLRLVLLSNLKIEAIDDPHLLSQLLYCCATQVAAGYEGSTKFLELVPAILKSLNPCASKLSDLDISQFYTAVQYFIKKDKLILKDYPALHSLLNSHDESVEACPLIHNTKVTSFQTNQVTISKQQERFFRVMKSYFPSLVHEPVIAGRRPDYYIPENKLVILYNGPGHYHFNDQGQIAEKNLSTILMEETMRLAGYTVVDISFEEYHDSESLDKLVKLKFEDYLPRRTMASKNQNAWFNRFSGSEQSTSLQNALKSKNL